MKRTIFVTCPDCQNTLEVDAESGRVIGHWAKGFKDPTKDSFAEGLKKIQEQKEKRKSLLQTTQEELAKKKHQVQESFQEKLNQAKKEGPQKPQSPFDLD